MTIRVFATLLLALLSVGTVFAQTFAEQLNPTGDPIAGGAGYSRIITQGQANCVATNRATLLSCLGAAQPGSIVFVPRDAVIDLSDVADVEVPVGVTLASDRGLDLGGGNVSDGGIIKSNTSYSGNSDEAMLLVTGSNARITGLRIQGPTIEHGDHDYFEWWQTCNGVRIYATDVEFDNNELYGWCGKFGLWVYWSGGDYETNDVGVHVHHNHFHNCASNGLGYCVVVGGAGNAQGHYTLIEANWFEDFREAIESSGHPNSWRARYNIVGFHSVFHSFDRHDNGQDGTGGEYTVAESNLFRAERSRHIKWAEPENKPGCGTVPCNEYKSIVRNNWFAGDCNAIVFDHPVGPDSTTSVETRLCQETHPKMVSSGNFFNGAGRTLPTAVVSAPASRTRGRSPLTVTLNPSSSTDPDGHAITRYRWDFGAGDSNGDATWTYPTNPEASYTYTLPGKYKTELLAWNSYGVWGETYQTSYVYPESNSGDYFLTGWVYDTYHGPETYYQTQVLVNGEIVWSTTVADPVGFPGDSENYLGWRQFAVNITDQVSANADAEVALRLYSTNSVTNNQVAGIQVYWDDLHIFGADVVNGEMELDPYPSWRPRIGGGNSCGTSQNGDKSRSGKRGLRQEITVGETTVAGGYCEWHQTVSFGPAQPTNVSATPGGTQISLAWNGVSGATGYKILRSTTGNTDFVEVRNQSGTSWIDTSVGGGTTYYYMIVAYNASGIESTWSSVTSATLSGGGGNQAPTASITSPSEGSEFSASVGITINAAASDPDGTVSRVEFYAGSTLLGQDTTAPYTVTWSNAAIGSHALTAKAFDNDAASTTSSPINITVVALPPNPLLLDLIPNAAAAFSPHKLRAGFPGAALRVRRSSDNAAQDIGFINNDLDVASLESFTSGSTAHLVKGYDQAGAGHDANQSQATHQPQLINGPNNKKVFSFSGSQGLGIPGLYPSLRGASELTIIIAAKWSGTPTSTAQHLFTAGRYVPAGGNYPFGLFLRNGSNALKAELKLFDGSRLDLDDSQAYTPGTWHIIRVVFNSSANAELWIDGTMAASAPAGGLSLLDAAPWGDGVFWGSNGALDRGWKGELTPPLVYARALSAADATLIEQELAAYYDFGGGGDGVESQNLSLAPGWNLVSTHIAPPDPSLEVVLSDILTNLVEVRNDAGETFDPVTGDNTIGGWAPLEAYTINVQNPVILTLEGNQIDPLGTPIPLNVGWNQIPYLRDANMPVTAALASIAPHVVLVKDANGQIYYPEFGINTIGDLQTGQGYMVYVDQVTVLTYPANTTTSAKRRSVP